MGLESRRKGRTNNKTCFFMVCLLEQEKTLLIIHIACGANSQGTGSFRCDVGRAVINERAHAWASKKNRIHYPILIYFFGTVLSITKSKISP